MLLMNMMNVVMPQTMTMMMARTCPFIRQRSRDQFDVHISCIHGGDLPYPKPSTNEARRGIFSRCLP